MRNILILMMVLIGWSRPASAELRSDYYMFGDKLPIVLTLQFVEWAFPDFRLEFSRNSHETNINYILSWPTNVDVEIFNFNNRFCAINMPFVEPQLVLPNPRFRVLLGDRFFVGVGEKSYFGLFIEGAFALAQDGQGGVFGAGMQYVIADSNEPMQIPFAISLGYRQTWTQTENRYDISLGFEFPIPTIRMMVDALSK